MKVLCSHWSTTRCWKPVVLLFNHNFINRVSRVMVQKWDGLQGAESGSAGPSHRESTVRSSQPFILKITMESFCGPATFSLLFCSCFIRVLHGTGIVSSTAWSTSPAQDHPVTGLAALRLLESLKKGDICSWGSGEPGLGLLPVGFEEETSPSRWCLWWLNCMLAFGVRGNRQSLHHVSAVAADLYQQPLLFTSCGGSPDVHICTWCSSDFGWVKKSRKGFNLSTCGH